MVEARAGPGRELAGTAAWSMVWQVSRDTVRPEG